MDFVQLKNFITNQMRKRYTQILKNSHSLAATLIVPRIDVVSGETENIANIRTAVIIVILLSSLKLKFSNGNSKR